MLIESEEVLDKTEESNDAQIDQQPETSKAWPLYNAKDHAEKFGPMEYLKDFYETAKEDEAMQIVLFFLPGIIYRIPQQIEHVLDLGAGPTVYIPIAMRNRITNFYTSDYSPANRQVLTSWIKNECQFDWKNVCEWISEIEASHESAEQMQADARAKMRAVLDVNVHKLPVVQAVHYKVDEGLEVPTEFDVVTTVFCLEYATETLDEYKKVVKNASTLIKKGGFLVQGGVLEANEYSFGGCRFKCHYLTKNQLLETLKESGFSIEQGSKDFHLILHDEIFILIAKKL